MRRAALWALLFVVGLGVTAAQETEEPHGSIPFDIYYSLAVSHVFVSPWFYHRSQIEHEIGVCIFDRIEVAVPFFMGRLGSVFSDNPSDYMLGLEVRIAPRMGAYHPSIGLGVMRHRVYSSEPVTMAEVNVSPLRFDLLELIRQLFSVPEGVDRLMVLVSLGDVRMAPLTPRAITTMNRYETDSGELWLSMDLLSISLSL